MTPQKTDILTDDLFLMLQEENDISKNWEQLSAHMDAPSFHNYLYKLISERGISIPKLGESALLSRSFTYQVFSGKRLPGRDIILRMALAAGFSEDETGRLLKLADRGALYPKVKRDAIIIYALSKKYDLYKTDELLISLGQKALL